MRFGGSAREHQKIFVTRPVEIFLYKSSQGRGSFSPLFFLFTRVPTTRATSSYYFFHISCPRKPLPPFLAGPVRITRQGVRKMDMLEWHGTSSNLGQSNHGILEFHSGQDGQVILYLSQAHPQCRLSSKGTSLRTTEPSGASSHKAAGCTLFCAIYGTRKYGSDCRPLRHVRLVSSSSWLGVCTLQRSVDHW